MTRDSLHSRLFLRKADENPNFLNWCGRGTDGRQLRRSSVFKCYITTLIGTSTAQTLNGGNAMDPHTESGTPVSSGPSSSSSDDASTSVPVVKNGPGVLKGHGNSVTVAPSPNTVIQSSYGNPPAAASAASSAGPSVTVVRPSMQTAGTGLTINGSNNNNTVSATVATVATPGITITTNFTTTTTTTTPRLMNQTPASVSASKPEATKTIIQPTEPWLSALEWSRGLFCRGFRELRLR